MSTITLTIPADTTLAEELGDSDQRRASLGPPFRRRLRAYQSCTLTKGGSAVYAAALLSALAQRFDPAVASPPALVLPRRCVPSLVDPERTVTES
jgi:hypothetical protein